MLAGILNIFNRLRHQFSRLPFTTFITVAFLAYLVHSLWSIYQIYNPAHCLPNERCVQPSWDKSTKFHITAFVSTAKELRSGGNLHPIWSEKDFDISNSFTATVNVTLPDETLRNGSLFLHLFLTSEDYANDRFSLMSLAHHDTTMTSVQVAPVTKFVIPKSKAFNLLDSQSTYEKSEERKIHKDNKPVTHWIPQLSVHIMSEPLPIHGVAPELVPYMRITKNKRYLPMLYIDHFGFLEKDFYPVNSSNEVMPLTLSCTPTAFGKMRLIVIVDYSLRMLEKYGFSEKDTDDVKAVFFDTNIYLLFLTFIVSGFHLLFDVLSFKNDITFWRNRKNNVGLSFRSLVWRCISQTIIFVYLYDQGTSLIVLVPAGVSIIIELWKVTKALKLKFLLVGWGFKFEFGHISDEERMSDSYDSEGMKYLTWLVTPCCLIYAAYSLLYIQHTSWFSWCIESVVNGVYAFGFIFMLPQLFVNYKLKSVAHIPWRAFMYKAFNTIVDDLFAFIISMPTAHRVACFRDDVVFVIYLYQRWLYPVDSRRLTEYSDGESSEVKVKAE